jgi:hypothetical protein
MSWHGWCCMCTRPTLTRLLRVWLLAWLLSVNALLRLLIHSNIALRAEGIRAWESLLQSRTSASAVHQSCESGSVHSNVPGPGAKVLHMILGLIDCVVLIRARVLCNTPQCSAVKVLKGMADCVRSPIYC